MFLKIILYILNNLEPGKEYAFTSTVDDLCNNLVCNKEIAINTIYDLISKKELKWAEGARERLYICRVIHD